MQVRVLPLRPTAGYTGRAPGETLNLAATMVTAGSTPAPASIGGIVKQQYLYRVMLKTTTIKDGVKSFRLCKKYRMFFYAKEYANMLRRTYGDRVIIQRQPLGAWEDFEQ